MGFQAIFICSLYTVLCNGASKVTTPISLQCLALFSRRIFLPFPKKHGEHIQDVFLLSKLLYILFYGTNNSGPQQLIVECNCITPVVTWNAHKHSSFFVASREQTQVTREKPHTRLTVSSQLLAGM